MTPEHEPGGRRAANDLAVKGFHHGRTPMLLLDSAGVVAEINAACRELLGPDAAGCKGRHFTRLRDRLHGKGRGVTFPLTGTASTHFGTDASRTGVGSRALGTEDLRVATCDYEYPSDAHGPISLRVSELPCVDTAFGNCLGSIVSFEVVAVSDPGAFWGAVTRRLEHEVLWEVYAASYDRVVVEMPFYQEVLERHCAALAADRIGTVLDVGAGTGPATVRLLQLGKRVTAVDMGRAMLEKLASKVDPEAGSRLTVIEDTAEHLPYLPDAAFDGVNVLLAFFDMDDPFSALAEAMRVLRPGGTLVVTEPRACFDVSKLMAYAEESLREKGLLQRLAADWARIQAVAPLIQQRIHNTQSRKATGQMGGRWNAEFAYDHFGRNGFTDLSFRESHMGNCATITGTKPACSIPLNGLVETVARQEGTRSRPL